MNAEKIKRNGTGVRKYRFYKGEMNTSDFINEDKELYFLVKGIVLKSI